MLKKVNKSEISSFQPILEIFAANVIHFSELRVCHWNFYEIRSRTHFSEAPLLLAVQVSADRVN